MPGKNILIWLPSPMGDAILSTPALRAIRRHFKDYNIFYLANPVVKQVLEPCGFNDKWVTLKSKNPFTVSRELKKYNFSQAILFKNSFASALAVFLAKIPKRIGYVREGRGFFLTGKLYPPKRPDGSYKPHSMVDYYLAVASKLGADISNKKTELNCSEQDVATLKKKLPELADIKGPVIVLVPGGAFGPSKLWPADRFAQVTDYLIEKYNATVIISVAPSPAEIKTAKEIFAASKYSPHNRQHPSPGGLLSLADRNLNLGELKALYAISDLVITNDTGPRHIAVALQRKVISLFGPNNPDWTDTGYENEIQIVGNVHCAPCHKPQCRQKEHFCMNSISTGLVISNAEQLLDNNRKEKIVCTRPEFTEIAESLFVEENYINAFNKLGLTSLDSIFSFNAGSDPGGSKIPGFRSRLEFRTIEPAKTLYLKRYNRPYIVNQLKNWLSHHECRSMMYFDFEPSEHLSLAGIKTPKLVAYGEEWGHLGEKRSFSITEEIPDAQVLDKKLPDCFRKASTTAIINQRRDFIRQLALLARNFHNTGYRHRDFYLAHIFYSLPDTFYLIDLQRAARPWFFNGRLRIKDIAQLYYSAPLTVFSGTDRLRFYKWYANKITLDKKDKLFIRKVLSKVKKILRHDKKHDRPITLYTDLAK